VIAIALTAAVASAALRALPPATLRGDGRTAVSVELSGGPDSLEGEDRRLPDGGSISCAGAGVVAASGASAPRVLAPATASPAELACVARRRGVEAVFSLHLDPPGPGLYAVLLPAPEPGQLTLRPFRVQEGKSVAPRSMHAGASAGELQAAGGGALRVALPPGRAPFAIAVALLDDEGEGAAFLPIPGRTQLRLRSKRRSLLSVRVAGATHGPVQAPEGKATMSVLVPPGTRLGVVRAVDRLGNAREVQIDLETPSLPRIAAVASATQVIAGGELRVAVALAAPDGAPAESAALRASARRGSLEGPVQRGGGLWFARYRAPRAVGRDRIAVDVEGDPAAGRVELEVDVLPGPPAQIALDLPELPARAGDELAVRAAVRDALGNAVAPVPLEASIAGAPARVSWEGATASVTGSVPGHLPASAVELLVRSGDAARAVARIEVRPAEAFTAELSAESARRTGCIRAVVRDRFGNALGASGFALGADGASVGPVQPSASGVAEASLEAAPHARTAQAWVTAGDRVLARTAIAFDPPPEAWLLFAWAQAGGMSNGGALRAPRFGAGLGIRRQFGPVEGGLLAGLDALPYRDEIAGTVGGAQQPVSRHLFALAVPLLLRARLPFARLFGASLEAGPIAAFAWSSASSQASGTERLVSVRPGVRARATVDFSVGRSRIALGASLGTARLVDGPVRGEIEGGSLFVGYEAWWFDIGP
jgi:hypothetical protein